MTAGFTRRAFLSKTVVAIAVTVLSSRFLTYTEDARAAGDTHVIDIKAFKFVPDTLKVRVGDTITWTNHDIVPHTATADDKSWDTGTLKRNERASLTVTAGMAPRYYCRFHPQMRAQIEIVGGD